MSLFLSVLAMVFVAEMGDKTQFLMIAMASKYKIRDILIGVAAAILVLNALAIGLGLLIGNVLPTAAINIVAGIAFLCFAYMAVGGDDEEEHCVSGKCKRNSIITVFGTFFIAELGDKTQLTALTLAADSTTGGVEFSKVIAVFLGASLALFAADVIGLLIGYFLGKSLPSYVFAWISFAIFAVFGVTKLLPGFEETLANTANAKMLSIVITAVIGVVFAGLTVLKLTRAKKPCGCAERTEEKSDDEN